MINLFKKLNISKQVLSKGASLLVVVVALVAAYVAFSMNSTLGWFAKNNRVTASGMVTQAYDAKFKITYNNVTLKRNDDGTITKTVGSAVEDPKDIITGVKIPGHSVAFDITIENVGLYAVNVTAVGLNAPSLDQDKPKVDVAADGSIKYYYLSTELTTDIVLASSTINKTKTDIEVNTTKAPQYLRQFVFNEETKEKTVGDAIQINYFDWLDIDSIQLEKGDSFTFTVEMTFVDENYDQNIFKNFADEGNCERSIFINYDE